MGPDSEKSDTRKIDKQEKCQKGTAKCTLSPNASAIPRFQRYFFPIHTIHRRTATSVSVLSDANFDVHNLYSGHH
jgi:hypothetical protein